MKCSVITVNYNNGNSLEKTILSTINQQKFNDFEYLVIDGGSSDNSVDVIKKYSDRIDFWVSEPDKGIYDAMNKAVAIAKGKYCIFMNSGDCFHSEYVLNEIFNTLNCQQDFIAGDYSINGTVRKSPSTVTAMTLFKTIERSICHQALFTKREILLRHPFQTEYRIVADFVNQFQSLIFDNTSYQYVHVTISDIEPGGLSAVNYKKLAEEKDAYLHSSLPQRIYDDYLTFMSIKLIEYSDTELYTILLKNKFNAHDIKIASFVLKIIGYLKHVKGKILNIFRSKNT